MLAPWWHTSGLRKFAPCCSVKEIWERGSRKANSHVQGGFAVADFLIGDQCAPQHITSFCFITEKFLALRKPASDDLFFA
jgi:hypothetical protein